MLYCRRPWYIWWNTQDPISIKKKIEKKMKKKKKNSSSFRYPGMEVDLHVRNILDII